MENTLENKAKFFAQYWGQEVLNHPEQSPTTLEEVVEGICKNEIINDYKNSFLELTPLSQITDEDACHIAMLLVDWSASSSRLTPQNITVRGRIDGDHVWDELVMKFTGSFKYTVRYRGGDFMTWIDSNGRCKWNTSNHQQVYDYLRSKGYALPWLDTTVEQLIEYGWIKFRQS